MDFKELLARIKAMLRSGSGRNVLSFMVFLFISTVFWFLLALNDDVQENYTLPVAVESFPENATMLSGYNPVLNVTIKDKGSSLMRYAWGRNPSMKIAFDDFTHVNDSTALLTSAQLNSAVRSIFGTSANVVAMRPDSLKVIYTTQPGVKVPIAVKSDIRTLPQYVYSGNPVCDVDSVIVYSNSAHRYDIHSIATKPVELANLDDTATVEIQLNVPVGMRAIPSTVRVVFPVEPLVAKKRRVAITAVNVPFDMQLVTFPSMVEVSYLLPKSMYNADNASIKAAVDYNMAGNEAKELKVSLSGTPSYFRSVNVTPRQVEYVVEQVD